MAGALARGLSRALAGPIAGAIGFNHRRGNGPPAPVLTRTTANSDNTPDYSLLATNPVDGDTFEVQESNSIDFSGSVDTTDLGFIAANPVAIPTSTVLADGPWWARAKMVHLGVSSAWSNVVAFTITTTSKLLLTDNSSFLLLEDGSSRLVLEA